MATDRAEDAAHGSDPRRPAAFRGPLGAVPPYDAIVFTLEGVIADTVRPRVFPDAADLLERLRAGGARIGLVAAGRDPRVVLGSAAALFDVIVQRAGPGNPPAGGSVATSDGGSSSPGMPASVEAMLLEVIGRLNAAPARTAVVVGDVAGVRAARRGGVGLVVGIARDGDARGAFEAAGVDSVLDDVGQLDLGVSRADPWLLVYEGFDPVHEGHREALTALGNGYLGTRGAAPECVDDGVHYPGTYLAGVYNRLTSVVQGRRVEDEHLVNAPNWLPVDLRIDDGGWWSDGRLTIEQERRELDLRRGLLTRRALLCDARGRRLQVTQRRLVSMHHPHTAALETTVVAQGWSGWLEVRSGIDAGVTNSNVAEYAGLAHRHLCEFTGRLVDPATLVVEAVTMQSRIAIAIAARTTVTGAAATAAGFESDPDGRHLQRFAVQAGDGQHIVIDKTATIYTSRDRAIAHPVLAALAQLDRIPAGVAGLLPGHVAAWERLWKRFAVELDTDRETRLVLNLHLFHLLQTISPHTAELDAGVPARGLHGEGYRGHVFWDELFVLPVIIRQLPAVARALLGYRWYRLDAARQAAREAGLAGALFPWQSGSDGREETPSQLFNPRSQRWMPDNSRRQRHVGLAVAVNAWRYYQATGDRAWLVERGAELIIEVARLFASLAHYDPAVDRFHLTGVMGPDEYHDGYPEAPRSGLRDNAYTNVLAAWVCRRAIDTVEVLAGHDCDDLLGRLGVAEREPDRWGHLSRRLAVVFHADGVISQFDGYEALAELDWARYRAAYGNIGRLDLILEAEGDTTNRYKLAKQADVLMLIYLLGPDELLELLAGLGYRVTDGALVRTVDYYLARTAHGSTLSRVVHASVLARIDPTRAWATFRQALVADLDDTQGGTTREGVHLGAMASTIDIITRAFAGQGLTSDTLTFMPRLPPELRRVTFGLLHHGQRLDVCLDHDRIRLAAHPCATAPVRLSINGESLTVGGGSSVGSGPPAAVDRHLG